MRARATGCASDRSALLCCVHTHLGQIAKTDSLSVLTDNLSVLPICFNRLDRLNFKLSSLKAKSTIVQKIPISFTTRGNFCNNVLSSIVLRKLVFEQLS